LFTLKNNIIDHYKPFTILEPVSCENYAAGRQHEYSYKQVKEVIDLTEEHEENE